LPTIDKVALTPSLLIADSNMGWTVFLIQFGSRSRTASVIF